MDKRCGAPRLAGPSLSWVKLARDQRLLRFILVAFFKSKSSFDLDSEEGRTGQCLRRRHNRSCSVSGLPCGSWTVSSAAWTSDRKSGLQALRSRLASATVRYRIRYSHRSGWEIAAIQQSLHRASGRCCVFELREPHPQNLLRAHLAVAVFFDEDELLRIGQTGRKHHFPPGFQLMNQRWRN